MNKTIKCRDCSSDFTLTDGEQQFFQQMGYQEPKRCRACRQQRKQSNSHNSDQKEQHGTARANAIQWVNGNDDRRNRKPNRGPRRRRDDFE